eukprot:UN24165
MQTIDIKLIWTSNLIRKACTGNANNFVPCCPEMTTPPPFDRQYFFQNR